MYKLQNCVQRYAWGSPTALTERFGFANPERLPMAEVWMGAHLSASSQVVIRGNWQSLAAEIASHPLSMLGQATYQTFQQLPFLVKLLAVERPLSIQVHPTRDVAQRGFRRENKAHIPLNAPTRNYRDANHKPELVYALTPFKALKGFKPFDEIARAFQRLNWDHPAVDLFIDNPTSNALQQLFSSCLRLAEDDKQRVLTHLLHSVEQQEQPIGQTVRMIAEVWPTDLGLLMPLFLNIITLQPGEALYLAAGTPHTYLQGVGIEVMANSDNVLRAGLTTKHIDIEELVANVQFQEDKAEQRRLAPIISGNQYCYQVPESDFSLSIITLTSTCRISTQGLPQLILCLEGVLDLSTAQQALTLSLGESLFIPADQEAFTIKGQGQIAVTTVGSRQAPITITPIDNR
ncbi:mannose-6-phosphate isomerase, class I [Rosenbergiella metrosideri]|uniref:mannose-6-phosphate isomerase, class I n=1 Tax=Rosenbergiella metrosideri TaxID=2921185 RepID=UPI001F4FEE00|nr:mannose-6-phosphate isomerase, class I [Rosenbergiella metrosideri]